ncbi:MAG: hypothetical protein WBL28_00400 [Methylotenera sp.]
MSLQDEHLQQALRHAPDSELEPSNIVRQQVLDYAAKAVEKKGNSLLNRCMNALNRWHVASWQLASMGSVAVALLVVVMIRLERPEDIVWEASAPVDRIQSKPAQDAGAGLALEREQTQDKKAERRKDVYAEKPAVNDASPSSQAVLAGVVDAAPKRNEKATLGSEGKTRLAEKSETPAAVLPSNDNVVIAAAPEVAAPQVAAPREPGKTVDMTDRAKEQTQAIPNETMTASETSNTSADEPVGRATGLKKQGEDSLGPRKMMTAEETKPSSKSKTDSSGQAGTFDADAGNAVLAQAIIKEGGREIARRDIGSGNLRILYLGKHFAANKPQDCGQVQPYGTLQKDELTGYRIELIAGCHSTEQLIREVDHYNQVVHEWYLEQAKNLSD